MKLFFFFLSLALFSCGTTKNSTVSAVQAIDFGSGGGFTGEVISYTLHPDGSLLKGGKPLKQIEQEKSDALFSQAEALTAITLKDPSNMYYFLTIKTGEASNTITWHAGSANPDARVTTLYKQLNSLTNK